LYDFIHGNALNIPMSTRLTVASPAAMVTVFVQMRLKFSEKIGFDDESCGQMGFWGWSVRQCGRTDWRMKNSYLAKCHFSDVISRFITKESDKREF